ncbi:hypothetical protein OSTOST_23552, partial [Ostertagia ostertagi]
CVWGDDLNLRKNLDYFRGLQVDGVIYDRIGEVRPRRKTHSSSKTNLEPLFTDTDSRSQSLADARSGADRPSPPTTNTRTRTYCPRYDAFEYLKEFRLQQSRKRRKQPNVVYTQVNAKLLFVMYIIM